MEKRSEEVLSSRRESGRRLAQLTQELSEKTEEAKSAGRKEEATEQRGRAEQLAIRLREARYGRILKLCSSRAPLLFLRPSNYFCPLLQLNSFLSWSSQPLELFCPVDSCPTRESEGKLEENFRAELTAQTKLAELYQEHSKEGNSRTEELTAAVRELQGLLGEAREKVAGGEAEVAELKTKHEVKISFLRAP